jgi:hypothetical protein
MVIGSLRRGVAWVSAMRIGLRISLGFTVILLMLGGHGYEAVRDVNDTAAATRERLDAMLERMTTRRAAWEVARRRSN